MSGLAITSLTLSHFRSHKSARLVFDGRPVAIAGPNGAGKTNVLEAISLLSPGRGLRRAGAEDLARRPEGIGWKIGADVTGIGADHRIETGVEAGARFLRIDDKPAAQGALGRILRILWLVPAMDRLWIEAAEGRRRFLDRIALSFFPAHAEAAIDYDKSMRERNRLLKEEVADARWYGAVEAQMAEAAAALMAHRAAALERLAGFAGTGSFPRADLAICAAEGAEEIAPADLPQLWAEGRRRDMAAGRTLVGPHRSDLVARYAEKDMPADQCSTGEQKALLISLILANARALAAELGRAPVILLDEVAAHLDPARRAALYDEICQMSAQAIMTGTEPALFDSLGARAQHLSITEMQGQSWVQDLT